MIYSSPCFLQNQQCSSSSNGDKLGVRSQVLTGSQCPSAPDKTVWLCWLVIHLNVPLQHIESAVIMCSRWGRTHFWWNAMQKPRLSGFIREFAKNGSWRCFLQLPSSVLVRHFFIWNCCSRPPVHHNLIRLHIFLLLLQCSCFLTPSSSQRKMCHSADGSEDAHTQRHRLD